MTIIKSNGSEDVQLDVGELFHYYIAKWKIFCLLGFLMAVVFAFYSLQLPEQYNSEATLVAADSGSNGIENLAGQLGGLATLAGVNLNSPKDNSLLAIQILESIKFLVDFVKAQKLEVLLFAVESWDAQSDAYIYNEKK